MPAGRKPKPTRLKLIDGNPGKRAINKNEPAPKTAARLSVPRKNLTAKTKQRQIEAIQWREGIALAVCG